MAVVGHGSSVSGAARGGEQRHGERSRQCGTGSHSDGTRARAHRFPDRAMPGRFDRPGIAVVRRSVDQEMRIFIEVPFCSTTRIFTPLFGTLTPWFGSSGNQYCLLSSNTGAAA